MASKINKKLFNNPAYNGQPENTWRAPHGVTNITITGCGGGGGGGAGASGYELVLDFKWATAGGGGGGASFTSAVNIKVIPGTIYTITIGEGGAGGVGTNNPPSYINTFGNPGETGRDTFFSNTVYFYGGQGGTGAQVMMLHGSPIANIDKPYVLSVGGYCSIMRPLNNFFYLYGKQITNDLTYYDFLTTYAQMGRGGYGGFYPDLYSIDDRFYNPISALPLNASYGYGCGVDSTLGNNGKPGDSENYSFARVGMPGGGGGGGGQSNNKYSIGGNGGDGGLNTTSISGLATNGTNGQYGGGGGGGGGGGAIATGGSYDNSPQGNGGNGGNGFLEILWIE